MDELIEVPIDKRGEQGFWPFREGRRAQVEALVQAVNAARAARRMNIVVTSSAQELAERAAGLLEPRA